MSRDALALVSSAVFAVALLLAAFFGALVTAFLGAPGALGFAAAGPLRLVGEGRAGEADGGYDVLCLSGRGDKDLATVTQMLGDKL